MERITYRELDIKDNGDVVVRVSGVPTFAKDEGSTSVGMFVVSRFSFPYRCVTYDTELYVQWKGEKLLGSWDVGSY